MSVFLRSLRWVLKFVEDVDVYTEPDIPQVIPGPHMTSKEYILAEQARNKKRSEAFHSWRKSRSKEREREDVARQLADNEAKSRLSDSLSDKRYRESIDWERRRKDRFPAMEDA